MNIVAAIKPARVARVALMLGAVLVLAGCNRTVRAG